MYETNKVAFCTDFSPNAVSGLDSFLFSVWNYELKIDIIHLIEDDEEESLRQIGQLKKYLEHQVNHSGNIELLIFKPDEKEKLFKHLNSEKYFYVELGLLGNGKGEELGAFFEKVYSSVDQDVIIVPPKRKENIDNRMMFLLEKKHLDYLYLVRKYANFLKFNYCRLTVLLLNSEKVEENEIEKIRNEVVSILPGLKVDVLIESEDKCDKILHKMIEEKKQSVYILFSDDYFYDFSLKFLKSHLNKEELETPCLKMYALPERIDLYKNNLQLAPIVELKEH